MTTRTNKSKVSTGPPPATPEAKEDQMISLAMKAAEEKLRNGTASTQMIVHFLKLGSTKERLEKEMLSKKTELLTAQTENLKSQQRVEELYENALKAMREYSGNTDDGEENIF